MRHPLNARQLTLTEHQRIVVMELRVHARGRPQIVHEYLRMQYPWLLFHKFWETGGNSISLSSDLDFGHEIHFLVSNRDDRVVTEYAGWPYFRLTI